MIPQRFVVEFPERCLTLLEMLEPHARKRELVGSFALLVASAAFLIPYERMKSSHPLHNRDDDLTRAIRKLDREQFATAPFCADVSTWRYSRIMNNVNDTYHWRDEKGVHPMSTEAENSVNKRKAGEVLRVLRNAIAHGNVVYLNAEGYEKRGAKVQYLGFLSRYEESEEQRKAAETYRLVVTTEDTFLGFVKTWAEWISKFNRNTDLIEAA
jgi:CRISPR/Cas system CMR-associated protein Cmr1 (group 7 of RAMP superfamily)